MDGARDPDDDTNSPVTVVVTRTVKRGREAKYEEYLRDITTVAREFPGHLGVNVIRPASPGAREYLLVFRFDSAKSLRRWENSREREVWVAKAAALTEGATTVQELTGMEGWFAVHGRTAPPPPRYKMAILSFVGAVPVIQILNAFLVPRLDWLPALARGAIIGAVMVVLMTYVVMPNIARLFARWLYP
ncbi:MAG: antibiotic biosynthesis monooxygenase [Polyangiaceae bacterium]|nr:antibiotic biosynthesis monooxygenase [Polyangiaceae bacterium]